MLSLKTDLYTYPSYGLYAVLYTGGAPKGWQKKHSTTLNTPVKGNYGHLRHLYYNKGITTIGINYLKTNIYE